MCADVRRHASRHLDTRTREQLGEAVLVEVWSIQSVKFLSEPHHQLRRRNCRRQLASLSKQGMQGVWQDPAEEVLTENSILLSHRVEDALLDVLFTGELVDGVVLFAGELVDGVGLVGRRIDRWALLLASVHVDILLALEGGAEGA
jgi:hypothetical protein